MIKKFIFIKYDYIVFLILIYQAVSPFVYSTVETQFTMVNKKMTSLFSKFITIIIYCFTLKAPKLKNIICFVLTRNFTVSKQIDTYSS